MALSIYNLYNLCYNSIMTEFSSPNQEWLATHVETFDALNRHVEAIAEQNTTNDELIGSGAVHTPELQDVLSLHLSQEQIEDFKGLQVTDRQLDEVYDEVMSRWDTVEHNLADVALKRSMMSLKDEDLRRQQELIVARRPLLAEKIGEVVNELEEKGRKQYSAELDTQEAELVSDAEAFEAAMKGYVLPRVINPANFTDDPEGEMIDTFPDDKLSPDIQDVDESARKQYIEEKLSAASEYLALFLAIEPGEIYTVEQLGAVLYAGDARSTKQRTACVAALISNHELSKTGIIQSSLAAEGLVMQRGAREIRDGYGKVVKHRVPIFRAINPNSPHLSETITRQADGLVYNDANWRDERADRLEKAQLPEDITPSNSFEKQVLNNLSGNYRQGFTDWGWLQDGTAPTNEVADYFEYNDEYPNAKSLYKSAAWKAIVQKAPEDVDALSLTDVVMISLYPEIQNAMRRNKNLGPRLRTLIEKSIQSWQEAVQETEAA
jgi:hypothetical protein